MPLNRDAILAAADLPRDEVEIPEWGGTVLIRGLMAGERDAYEMEQIGPDGKVQRVANWRARLVARCLIDEAGERLFGDDRIPDLARKSGAVIDRLYDVAARLSGMRRSAVEDAEKNSGGAPDDGSSSGLRTLSDPPLPSSAAA